MDNEDVCGTLCADTHPGSYSGQDAYSGRLVVDPIAFNARQDPDSWTGQIGGDGGISGAIADTSHAIHVGTAIRRLTPVECERLQGFSDDYTQIPWKGKAAGDCPDGPRYKALGNSMAVPVMRWIGQRIAKVEAKLLMEAARGEA